MSPMKFSAATAAMLLVSTTSFAVEPGQRSLELALSLNKQGGNEKATAQLPADARAEAAAAIHAQIQAMGPAKDAK